MKRCPECYQVYEDSEKFCELDGQLLFADPALGAPGSPNATADSMPRDAVIHSRQFTPPREAWFIGTAGVLLGMVTCVGGYLAYGLWKEDAGTNQSGTATFTQTQAPIQPSRPPAAPRAETSPPEEEAATNEAETSPEPASSPTEESDAVTARLNQGPVSTGQRKKAADDKSEVQTIIQMNDGTAVEVDAAWEDAQGVWYRRGGMVAFVESQRVKAITGRAVQKPSSGSTQ
jgi:hypothetical protein